MFNSNPKLTLLFIGRDRLVRFDVRGTKVLGLWQRSRPSQEELPALVETTLRQSKARPGKVWILSTDLWTQLLAMPRESLNGLQPDEIGRALAFEAESLSGNSALDSEIGYVPSPGNGETRDFRIVQIATWMRDEFDQIIRSAKGTLAGITHPGGLPESMADRSSGFPAATRATAWQRVEIWPGAIVGVARNADGALRQFVHHADLRGTAWKASWDRWAASNDPQSHEERLLDMGLSLPATFIPSDQEPQRLADEPTLTAWLTQWAGVLARNDDSVPKIIPAKRPVTASTRALVAAALFGVVASVAAVDGWKVRTQITAAKTEIAQRQAETKTLETLRTQITAAEKRLAERGTAIAKFERESSLVDATLKAHRTRWACLLESLERNSRDELAIREITSRGGHLTLHGICIGPHAANELATRLNGNLAAMGWTVSPARKTLGKTPAEDEPWRFELELAESESIAADTAPVLANERPLPEPPRTVVSAFNESTGATTNATPNAAAVKESPR